MPQSYRVVANIKAEAALDRIKDLLAAEGVSFEQIGPTLRSTKTPIIVLGIQPSLYSRRNWVGLNPFVFISGVTIGASGPSDQDTIVEISIDRLRAYVLALLVATLGFVVGRAMPQPAGVLLSIGVVLSAWLGIVLFLAGQLVKGEICHALESDVKR